MLLHPHIIHPPLHFSYQTAGSPQINLQPSACHHTFECINPPCNLIIMKAQVTEQLKAAESGQSVVVPSQEQQLFHIAFGQRKKLNLQRLKQYMQARGISQRERVRIYGNLQTLYREKIEYTKNFIKDFIRYFEDTLALYGSFFKAIGKLDLSKKPKEHFIYESFERVALELTELNTGEVESLKVLTNWIEKILLPALRAVYDMYRDSCKDDRKEMENLNGEADSARQKEQKFYEKITDNNDLLENEIILVDKFQATDEITIRWGNKILKAWESLLAREGEIREQLQKNIIEFHDKFTRVYNESECSKGLLKFWMELQAVPSWYRTFASVLTDKDTEFIAFGCKSGQLKTAFEPFAGLVHEKERIGDPIKLIDILQNKRFKCKLQKSQREYIPIRLYFTIDKNVLLFDETKKKVIMKLREDGFRIRRLSENLVELTGIEVGMLIDSKRRENVHFGTMDEAEEFIFFVENLMKENA